MDINSRRGFLQLALMVEGGTLLLGLGLSWFLSVELSASLQPTPAAIGLGLLGTLPIFAVYWIASGPRSIVIEMMGQALSRCRWYDLLLLAALAGIGEELLFRGVLQPWLSGWSPLAGLLAANLLFGLVHAVTPMYALLAAGIGLYLSGIAYAVPHANLLSAMVTHGVYDYVAFLLIIREHNTARDEIAGLGRHSGEEGDEIAVPGSDIEPEPPDLHEDFTT